VAYNLHYMNVFQIDEQSAINSSLGLWQPATIVPLSVLDTPDMPSNCSPAYPGVCIPPGPPDLDCKDVHYKNFRVLPPVLHHFDRDKDGIGCES
jgi:micrococcal nuclease